MLDYLKFGTTCRDLFFFFTFLDDYRGQFKWHLHDSKQTFTHDQEQISCSVFGIYYDIMEYILGINLPLLSVSDSCEKGLLVPHECSSGALGEQSPTTADNVDGHGCLSSHWLVMVLLLQKN